MDEYHCTPMNRNNLDCNDPHPPMQQESDSAVMNSEQKAKTKDDFEAGNLKDSENLLNQGNTDQCNDLVKRKAALRQEIAQLEEEKQNKIREKDEISKSLEQLKSENYTLSEMAKESEQRSMRIKELDNQISSDKKKMDDQVKKNICLQKEVDDMKIDASRNLETGLQEVEQKMNAEILRLANELKDFQQKYQTLCSDREQLLSNKCELEQKLKDMTLNFMKAKADRDELSKRLSEEWNSKVAADESNIENVSIQNRPLNIATKYESLCSTEWLDAKEEVDTVCSQALEDHRQALLCKVFLTSQAVSLHKYTDLMKTISALISKPVERYIPFSSFKLIEKNVDVTHLINQNILNSGTSDSQGAEYEPNKNDTDLECKPGTSKQTDMVTEVSSKDDVDNILPKKMNINEDFNKSLGSCGSGGDNGDCLKSDDTEPMEYESEQDTSTAENPQNDKPAQQEDQSLDTTGTDHNKHNTVEEERVFKDIYELAKCQTLSHKICELKLPDQLCVTLGDVLRSTSNHVDMKELTQDIIIALNNIPGSTLMPLLCTLDGNDCFNRYVSACAALAWNMVIQRPKMTFDVRGIDEKWNVTSQEPVFGGDDPSHEASVVQYYQHPTLMHADKVMVKGKVLTKISK